MDTLVSILCMKWGSMYGPEYVNHLREGVSRHLKRPHRFICFTDDATGLRPDVEVHPLPELGLPDGSRDTRWRKLAVFQMNLAGLSGTALFLDLDVVIVNDLEPLFEQPGTFLIIRDDDLFRAKPLRRLNPGRDRFKRSVGNSSVFRFEIGRHHDLLSHYIRDPGDAGARYDNEQEFISGELLRAGLLSYWPKAWCVSFKNHCVSRNLLSYFTEPKLPGGARIVVFAGQPKMMEVLAGGGQRWYRRIGNVDWLRRAWMG